MSVAGTYATQTSQAASTTTATGGATSTTASQGAADASRGQIASNFGDFLRLLTTQLQNQDPTSPLDTNQFTSQLVQFASVEQQISMNKNMEQLIALAQGEQLAQASAMLGAAVEADADMISLQGGRGEIRFDADGTARYEVSVLDASGRAMRQQMVDAGAGTASWSWDGRAADGRTVADGAYRTTVTRLGTDGTSTQVPFRTVATATGAEREGSSLELALGELTVGFGKVRRIVQPAR